MLISLKNENIINTDNISLVEKGWVNRYPEYSELDTSKYTIHFNNGSSMSIDNEEYIFLDKFVILHFKEETKQ